jgi:hypothetical protein
MAVSLKENTCFLLRIKPNTKDDGLLYQLLSHKGSPGAKVALESDPILTRSRSVHPGVDLMKRFRPKLTNET